MGQTRETKITTGAFGFRGFDRLFSSAQLPSPKICDNQETRLGLKQHTVFLKGLPNGFEDAYLH